MSDVTSSTAPFPWEQAHERVVKGFALRLPEPLMAKLQFLKENEANVSVHKLILQGIEKELDARLPRYGYQGPNRHY
jgi:hypothetical protein